MRELFSDLLVEHVSKNQNIYLLSGDHGYALFDKLRKEKPMHFLNAGVAEQNMVGVGAGLAKTGFFPIMYGLSAFVPIRVLEQIKIDFCYENLPGLFIGDGAGVVYSHLGTSHQSTEDIAALRAIPNLSVLSPCDDYEFKACFNWALEQKHTVYIRMGKADLGAVHKSEISHLSSTPLSIIRQNSDLAFFATGSMVKTCQEIIDHMKIKADLYSVPVLKQAGVSSEALSATVSPYKRIITFEEHSIYGGLGDLVCAVAAELGTTRVKKIGISDRFSQYCGTYQYLMKEHGLDLLSLDIKVRGWL